MLGWPVARRDSRGAAVQVGETSAYLSFQEATGYARPVWPAEPGKQLMMMHVDVAAAAAAALDLGATLAGYRRRTARCFSTRRAIPFACTSTSRDNHRDAPGVMTA